MPRGTEWQPVLEALEELGCEIRWENKGGHFKIYQGGKFRTTLPSSPGSVRALANSLGKLRREIDGFAYRPKQPRRKKA